MPNHAIASSAIGVCAMLLVSVSCDVVYFFQVVMCVRALYSCIYKSANDIMPMLLFVYVALLPDCDDCALCCIPCCADHLCTDTVLSMPTCLMLLPKPFLYIIYKVA